MISRKIRHAKITEILCLSEECTANDNNTHIFQSCYKVSGILPWNEMLQGHKQVYLYISRTPQLSGLTYILLSLLNCMLICFLK